ncbi:hypothetical protein MTE01_28690 [Microbacterium testaceum]|uniref:Uncharacterized protein n=1 Tax=Microbacterium testaceum TaxID=2033 RepID=A0A4Y3QNQ8_MICTE|nr:CHAD domain-containing protein [Microbacterium testaceum]GEB46924.1 hypothetical protein MTE01_28690 [Microbacterium testaceum]
MTRAYVSVVHGYGGDYVSAERAALTAFGRAYPDQDYSITRVNSTLAMAFGRGWNLRDVDRAMEDALDAHRAKERRERDSLERLERIKAARKQARRLLASDLNSPHGRTPAIDFDRKEPDMGPTYTLHSYAPADRFMRDLLREVAPAAFPSTAKKGAKVKLTHKTVGLVLEFTVGNVTRDAYSGGITHIAVEGNGALKYAASEYRFVLVQPAPEPLPTKVGVYVREETVPRYNRGEATDLFTLLPGGKWTQRYGAGTLATRTAEEVQAITGPRKLVRLTA